MTRAKRTVPKPPKRRDWLVLGLGFVVGAVLDATAHGAVQQVGATLGLMCILIVPYWMWLSQRGPLDNRPASPWPDETGIVRWRRKRREKAAAQGSGKLGS
jgi:hypothetical protein